MNETDTFAFPSITLCPKFKDGVGMADTILIPGEMGIEGVVDKRHLLTTFDDGRERKHDEGPQLVAVGLGQVELEEAGLSESAKNTTLHFNSTWHLSN